MAIELSSHEAFLAALRSAHDVRLSAYCLGAETKGALESAAEHGAHVAVCLEGTPVDDPRGVRAAANARAIAELRRHGVEAHLAGNDLAVHTKAALVDGVAWLDDRNFPRTGPDLVVRDSEPDDVRAIERALDGLPARGTRLGLIKGDALAIEARTIAEAPRGEIDVETESFNTGPIYHELVERAACGDRVRLLVDVREARRAQSEAHALAAIAKHGVEVRLRRDVDKLAVCADRAWIGSANATYPDRLTAGQSDWGLATASADAVAALRARFEDAWHTARPA